MSAAGVVMKFLVLLSLRIVIWFRSNFYGLVDWFSDIEVDWLKIFY